MDYENENPARYEGMSPFNNLHPDRAALLNPLMEIDKLRLDEAPRYERERDRSASPRPTRRNDSPRGGPRRSASPNGNGHADSRSVPP